MPISPDPPSARKSSSLPGVMRPPYRHSSESWNPNFPLRPREGKRDSSLRWNDGPGSGFPAPRIKHRQPANGEVPLDRVERIGMGMEQGGEAAGGDDLDRAADLRLQPRDQPFDHRDIAP